LVALLVALFVDGLPDLSVKAMLARHGERELAPEEFEQHFGQSPRRAD
jgi:hypothetical protein